MRLVRVQVKHFRSFADLADMGDAIDVPLSTGMNAIVGPNNCGKSNLLGAIALALDPNHPFDQHDDAPAQLAWAHPRVTVTFEADSTGTDGTLLRYAHEYEMGVSGKSRTFASDGLIKFAVTYKSGRRQESFLVKGLGARTGAADDPSTQKLTRKFWSDLRFIYVRSGESLESLLKGRFREILHVVLAEHLKDAITAAEVSRQKYATDLQDQLLSALRDRVSTSVGGVFSEIDEASLVPRIPEIGITLADVDVRLKDSALTSLVGKGTGVRGAVMVAMLRYMADQSRRTMVLAVEEPESFLHPAAQEDLRVELESLAKRHHVSLLVTTHSAFMVSRDADARVIQLEKTASGRTALVATREGGHGTAPLLSALYRDPGLPLMMERAQSIPASARAVIVTEGYTDGEYLRIAAQLSDRPELVENLHIISAGGATKVPPLTVLTRAATSIPVLALLDSDDMGRVARDTLVSFGMSDKREVVMLHSCLPQKDASTDPEAEDLWPASLMKRFVDEHGLTEVIAEMSRRGDTFRYGLNATGKSLITQWIAANAQPKDAKHWIAVLDVVNDRVRILAQIAERDRARSNDPSGNGRVSDTT